MIIDANELDSAVIETDICIVGSGIGGGALAPALFDANISFTIIEAGDITGNSENVQPEKKGLSFGLSTTTSIELGGTSNLWHGVLAPLDPIDFEKRSWIPHSGWPVGYREIEPFFKKAARLFNVPSYDFFYDDRLPEDLAIERGKMPIDRKVVRNKLFQQPLPTLRFKTVIRKLLEKSKDKHCIVNATALELISSGSNPEQIKTLLVSKNNKEKFHVEAKVFVLAAGALETPRLLLNSRGSFAKGIGNEFDNVGRYLMDHPMGNLFQVEFIKKQKAHLYSDMKYHPNCKIKTGLVLKDEFQHSLQMPNHNFYLRPSFVKGIHDESEKIKLALLTFKDRNKRISLQEVWNVASNYNVAFQILAYKLALNVTYKFADIFFLTEQVPDRESRVTLSSTKDRNGYPIASVAWKVTNQDLESMKSYFDILTSKVFLPSHFRITHRPEDLNWTSRFTSAAHHVGTARMSETSREGVTDRHQKVFGTRNVYVADGSLFSTSGNINSGFSIAAFAIRLADHLSTHELKK